MVIFVNDITLFKTLSGNSNVKILNNPKKKNLILTGYNGCGLSFVLREIAYFVDEIKTDLDLSFLQYKSWIEKYSEILDIEPKGSIKYIKAKSRLQNNTDRYNRLYRTLDVTFSDYVQFIKSYNLGDFILGYYHTDSYFSHKINSYGYSDNLSDQLSNIVNAQDKTYILTRAKLTKLEKINHIFKTFFEDEFFSIFFDKNGSWSIKTRYCIYSFRQLPSSYSYIMGLILDIILKMNPVCNENILSFDKHGLILIDDIEANLAENLKYKILPFLSDTFPNIQFIVSTRSDLVLESSSEETEVFDFMNLKNSIIAD